MKKPLKDVELRLISELMKNSRRSDRQLARIIGISQPTVTRVRTRLEKTGVIKEYTMIPDFLQLGYTIMGATSLQLKTPLDKKKFEEVRNVTTKIEQDNPHAALMAVNASGGGKNRLFITFYENYSDYANTVSLTRQIPFLDIDSVESLLVDLNDETNYRIFSMSAMADDLAQRAKKGNKP